MSEYHVIDLAIRDLDALVAVLRHIGHLANDLGVVRVEEAPGRVRYDLVYSEYDLRVHRQHLERVKQEYAREVALRTARRLGYRRLQEERRPDGTIVLRLSR